MVLLIIRISGVIMMEKVQTSEGLMKQFTDMNHENSVRQVFIPGKGRFTIVLQEEEQRSIADDVKANPALGKMIRESMEAYKEGKYMTTSEVLKSLSPKDFIK
jgi:hypothetical protein